MSIIHIRLLHTIQSKYMNSRQHFFLCFSLLVKILVFFVFQYAIDTETTFTRGSNNGYSIPHPAPVRIFSTYLDTVWSHVFRITSVTCDLPIFISLPAVNFKSSPHIPSIKKANPVPVENIFIPHPQLKILSSRTPHNYDYTRPTR